MSTPPFADLDRAGQLGRAAAASAAIVFTASALGYAACLRSGAVGDSAAPWLAFGIAALVAACVAAVMMERVVLAPMRRLRADLASLRHQVSGQAVLERELAERAEQQRRLRHDLRGALSPVLLVADRLLAHADPAVKRSGDIMVRAVERSTELLAEPGSQAKAPG